MLMFLLLFSMVAPSFAYDIDDFHFTHVWKTQPQIVLCDDAKITKWSVISAIAFWNNVGIDVKPDIVQKACHSNFSEGEIQITAQRDLDLIKYYGYTERNYKGKILNAATIKIEDASSQNLELLVHELGHALGIGHEKDDLSHIMHTHLVDNDTRWE